MTRKRQKVHRHIPEHVGARPENNRFGMTTVQNVQYFTLPRRQPDYRCGECNKTWTRETATVALASDGRRHVAALSGWWSCCGARFKWGE